VSDPIRDLAERLARVERELHALSTAPRAPHTSVSGGYTRWLPPQGESPRLQVGSGVGADVGMTVTDGGELWIGIGTESGVPRALISSPDRSRPVFDVIGGDMIAPLIPCPWVHNPQHAIDSQGRTVVPDAAYIRAVSAYLPVQTGGITTSIIIDRTGTATVAARVRATVIAGATSGGVQTVHEETGITGATFLSGLPWAIPDAVCDPASDPHGTLVLLEVEARVTAGSGNALVAPSSPVVNIPL
jgi:hypothetical protein